MKVKIDRKVQEVPVIQLTNQTVEMIDQRVLPFKLEIIQLPTWEDTVHAIKNLATRGAGSVGVAGAFAMVQAAYSIDTTLLIDFQYLIEEASQIIAKARPTAVTLDYAVQSCLRSAGNGKTIDEKRELIKQAALKIQEMDKRATKIIGQKGAALLKKQSRILTHCNTGALAIQDYGSALGVIRFAHAAGKLAMVYISETRPWLQGSRLNTWELQQEDIPHQLVIDSACGYLFLENLVTAVIVGADRIAANGDVANKIGTYEKAVLAHEHRIPFFVAAPIAAFDLECPNGKDIAVEQRPAKEVRTVTGRTASGEIGLVQVAPERTDVLNPVFDITPAKYVSGFITENGVLTKISTKKIRQLIEKGSAHEKSKGI